MCRLKYCMYRAGAEEHRRVFGVKGSDVSTGGGAEGLAGGSLDTLMRQSDVQKSVEGRNATAGGGDEVDSRGAGMQNGGGDGGAVVDGSQW